MLFEQIKTPSDLRAFIENAPEGSHFFDRDTMRFFGDTMKNFGVSHIGNGVIELYRRRPVKNGLNASSYWVASKDGTYAVKIYEPGG